MVSGAALPVTSFDGYGGARNRAQRRDDADEKPM